MKGLGNLLEIFTGQSSKRGAKTVDMILFTMCTGDRMSYSASYRPLTMGVGGGRESSYATVVLEAVRDMCEGRIFDLAGEEYTYDRFFDDFETKICDTYPGRKCGE